MNQSIRRSQCLAVMCLLSGLLLVGCGRGGGPEADKDDSRDPAAYAMDVKQRIAADMSNAERNPSRGQEIVQGVVEFLGYYKSNPVGDHESIYADLLAGCEELAAMYERSAKATETKSKIEEIRALADKLPGASVSEPAAQSEGE